MNVANPTVTNTTGSYQLDFSDERSQCIDRISENSKYETIGEITISSRIPGSTGHLHRARLNLTSSPSRKAMSKVLEDIQPGVPWTNVLEYVSVIVLDKHPEGTPTIKLADHSIYAEGLVFRWPCA